MLSTKTVVIAIVMGLTAGLLINSMIAGFAISLFFVFARALSHKRSTRSDTNNRTLSQ